MLTKDLIYELTKMIVANFEVSSMKEEKFSQLPEDIKDHLLEQNEALWLTYCLLRYQFMEHKTGSKQLEWLFQVTSSTLSEQLNRWKHGEEGRRSLATLISTLDA